MDESLTTLFPQVLLDWLVCPEDKTSLRLATAEELQRVNAAIATGTLCNRGQTPLTEPLQEALVRADQQWMYPIRGGIAMMLVEEAIPLSSLTEEREPRKP